MAAVPTIRKTVIIIKYNIDRLNSDFFLKIRDNADYAFLIDEIKKAYNLYCESTIEVLPYSKRRMFVVNGNRSEFENMYFSRRKYLYSAALLALIYPENSEYIEKVQDLIFAICEEYCWAVPAHGDDLIENESTLIDLFSAETARSLSEIDYLLGDRLDAKLRQYLRIQINKRVFEGYLSREYFWQKCDTNWAAVCPCNVATAMMLLNPEMFEKCLPSFLNNIEGFLSGYPESGLCMEGPSYWSYGFSAFAYFADDLIAYTDGKINLFENEKVKKIAEYMQTTILSGGASVSFADASMDFCFYLGLQYLLNEKFTDSVKLFDKNNMTSVSNDFWQLFSRSLMYYDPEREIAQDVNAEYFYKDANQYFMKNNVYSFACKGGYNNELHNHNDIGSFIIATSAGQVLCDLGSGKYTREYFSKDRYNVFCCGSQGHSVPIINGNYQRGFRRDSGVAELVKNNNCISLEYSLAYNVNMKSLSREFCLLEDRILLTDSVDFEFDSFVDRFVTLIEPKVSENTVTVADLEIVFDKSAADLSITKVMHLTHREGEVPVWCIDFSFNKNTRIFKLEMIVKDAAFK